MRFSLPICLLLLAGCVTTQQQPETSAVYDEGRSQRAAVPLDSVEVFGPFDEVPALYRRFGTLASQSLVTDTTAGSVLLALREEAAAVGAEAVQITQRGLVDRSGGAVEVNPATGRPSFDQGLWYRIQATAFHRTDRGFQPPDSVLTGE